MKISSVEYQRWIRPQIKTIVNEYYTLISSIDPRFKEFVPFASSYKRIWNDFSRYSKCKKHRCDSEIKTVIKSVYTLMNKLEDVKIQADKVTIESEQIIQSKNMLELSKIYLFALWSDLSTQQENQKLFNTEKNKKVVQKLKISYLQSRLHFHMYLINQLDSSYRNLFEQAWGSFINPIESKVIFERNISYLNTHVNELNIAWNELHLSLTKRNIKISKQSITLLNIMHRRWNSVLKIGLR